MLNGQHSFWADVQAGVPQGSILGPLQSLIYINDLPNGLNSNAKLFADDLSRIDEWALHCKMSFNLDPTKQAQ